MSHIHIPDGVLPAWLWVSGWALALGLVWLASRRAVATDARRRVPLLGVVSALVLVSMSSEIVPLAYHVNLTVVAGVLLGPWLGLVSAFVVTLVLALLGHGGVTVVGLNALLIGAEMVVGGTLFRLLAGASASSRRVRGAAAISTVLTLAMTTAALVGIVALAGSSLAGGRETGALDPGSLRFDNPFSHGVVAVNTLRGESDAPARGMSTRRFAAVVFTLGPLGWAIEAAVTAAVLGYVARVRPGLVLAAGPARGEKRLPSHERGRR
ncbi:MAG: energy-coupling factor ABC transporter permease [Coriobacteriia bacterium]